MAGKMGTLGASADLVTLISQTIALHSLRVQPALTTNPPNRLGRTTGDPDHAFVGVTQLAEPQGGLD